MLTDIVKHIHFCSPIKLPYVLQFWFSLVADIFTNIIEATSIPNPSTLLSISVLSLSWPNYETRTNANREA